MIKRFFALFFIIFLTGTLGLLSCKKDKISSDVNHKLTFSVDTLAFDTVFTSVGSSTRIFKIFNPNKQRVKITSIKLGAGSNSFFRVNLNGQPGVSFSNIEIPAEDSLWVFAEVTVNPNSVNNPFIVLDSILFETNGNFQKVLLTAYGQNAVFHKPLSGQTSYFLNCNETWDKSIPHVIYGKAIVDTNCILTINEGTQVYFYDNGALQVSKGASLKIKGTFSEPVKFEGSRLESWYENTAGQWEGLVLDEESQDHDFSFLHLKNARIGIDCNAINMVNPVALKMSSCKISNCSKEGLILSKSSSTVLNSLVSNCGKNAVNIKGGGSHEFIHCTISNEVNSSEPGVTNESLRISNYSISEDGNVVLNVLTNCSFKNTIVYSNSLNNAIVLDEEPTGFSYEFINCLLKTDASVPVTESNFVSCITNQSPDFLNFSDNKFQLEENSAAINKADVTIVSLNTIELTMDLDNYSRLTDSSPDIGAYEFYE